MNIVIPMAGAGSRFPLEEYQVPKPLILVNGIPMIARAVESLGLPGKYHFIVRNNEFLARTLEAINSVCIDPVIIAVDNVTEGAAVTALLCKKYIQGPEELVIANCDQIMAWDSQKALQAMREYEGCVVTVKSQDPKHSYVKVNKKGEATSFAEKIVISDDALTGIHYWRHGHDFVASAEYMIADDARSSNGEFYIAPTYNYMLKQKRRVGVYSIPESAIHFVGTPPDLEKYINENR